MNIDVLSFHFYDWTDVLKHFKHKHFNITTQYMIGHIQTNNYTSKNRAIKLGCIFLKLLSYEEDMKLVRVMSSFLIVKYLF